MKINIKIAAEPPLITDAPLGEPLAVDTPSETKDIPLEEEMAPDAEEIILLDHTEEAIKNDVRVVVNSYGASEEDEFNAAIDIYKLSDGIWEKVSETIDCKTKTDLAEVEIKKLAEKILNEVYESVRIGEEKDYNSICKQICRDTGIKKTSSGPGEATLTIGGKSKSKLHNWKMHLDNGNITIITAPNRKKALIKAKLMCQAYGLENCNYSIKPASKEEVEYITSMGGLVHEDVLKEAIASWTPQTDQVESDIFPVAGTPTVPAAEFPVGIKNQRTDLGMGITTERDQYGIFPGFYPQAHTITQKGFEWRLNQIKELFPNSKNPIFDAKASNDPMIRRYGEELQQKVADTRYSNPDPMSQDPIATVKSKGVPLKGSKVKLKKKSKNFGYKRPWPTETEATEGNYETHLGNLTHNDVKIVETVKENGMKEIIASIEKQIAEGYAIDEILTSLKKEGSVRATELTKTLNSISQAVDGILKEEGVMISPITKETASQLDECRDHLQQINETSGSFLSAKAQTHIRNFIHAVNTLVKITSNPHIKNYCQVIIEDLNEINEISTLRKLNVEGDESVKHVHNTDHKSKVKNDLRSFVTLSKQVQKDKKLQEKEIYKMFVEQLTKHTEKLEKVYEELGEFHNPQGEAVILNLHTIINNIKVVSDDDTIKKCVKMTDLLEFIGHHGELHTKLIKEIQPITPLEYTPITDTHEETKNDRVASKEQNIVGCKEIYSEGPYTVFEIDKTGFEALSAISKNTKWATSNPEKAKTILNRSNVYGIFKNGKAYAQVSKAYEYLGLGIYANNISIKPNEDKEIETVLENSKIKLNPSKRYASSDYIWSDEWKKALKSKINAQSSLEKIASEIHDEVEYEAAIKAFLNETETEEEEEEDKVLNINETEKDASFEEKIDFEDLLKLLPESIEISKTFTLDLDLEDLERLKAYLSDSEQASSKEIEELGKSEDSLTCTLGKLSGQEFADLLRGKYSIKDTDKIVYGPYEVSQFFIQNDIHIQSAMLED